MNPKYLLLAAILLLLAFVPACANRDKLDEGSGFEKTETERENETIQWRC